MSPEGVTMEEALEEALGRKPSQPTRESDEESREGEEGEAWSSTIDEEIPHSSVLMEDEDEDLEASDEDEDLEASDEDEDEEEGEPATLEEVDEDLQLKLHAAERERDRLRTARREDRELLEAMRQDQQALAEAFREATTPPPPEGIDEDPHLSFFNERLKNIETALSGGEGGQGAPQGPTAEQVQATRAFAQESAASLRQAMPQFDDAYSFARRKLAEESGYKGEAFNILELGLIYEMQQNGQDPAVEAVKYAKAHGWKPGSGDVETSGGERRGAVPKESVRRVKRGVRDSKGDEGVRESRRRSGTLSQKQFYKQFDGDTRKKIFMEHPEAFEELARTGAISTKYLSD